MNCDCSDEICRCPIPCQCLEETCNCPNCVTSSRSLCKICDKPLLSNEDEETCVCFVVNSEVLIIENRDKPKRRLGDMSLPSGSFVPGKLTVQVMIPNPSLKASSFIPQKSFCHTSELPLPIVEASCTFENPEIPSTQQQQRSDKSDDLLNGTHSSVSFCKQKSERPARDLNVFSPEFLPSADKNVGVNVVPKAKSETEDRINCNRPEVTAFYLPSIQINNTSYPVNMMDPVWTLPNPEVGSGGFATILNVSNPFYEAGSVQKTRRRGDVEKYRRPPSYSSFETCATSGGNHLNVAYPSNSAMQNECTAYGNSTNFDGFVLPDQTLSSSSCVRAGLNFQISATGENEFSQVNPEVPNFANQISYNTNQEPNYEVPQTVPLGVSASGEEYFSQVDANFANQISYNVPQKPNAQELAIMQLAAFDNLPPAVAFPSPLGESKFNAFFTSSQEYGRLRKNYSLDNSEKENAKENLPLYVNSVTTQKMEKLLK